MLIIKAPKKSFEIPDEGTHPATIVDVKDLGSVQTTYGMKDKGLLTFEVEQTDGEGKRRRAFKRVTKTLHQKGTLYKIIRSTGEDPDVDEFDLAKLIGHKVTLVIEHRQGEGSTFADVTTVMRVKSTEPPSAGAPVVRPSGPEPIRPKNCSGSAEVLPDDIPEPDQDGNVTAVVTPDNTGVKKLAS